MAKQVKVFDVTIGATSTVVYTVPAGRVAKIVVTRFGSYGSFFIGGYDYGVSSGPITDAAQQPGDWNILVSERYVVTQGDGWSTSTVYGYRNVSRIRTHFLPAGATITMLNASAQFCVIEEF